MELAATDFGMTVTASDRGSMNTELEAAVAKVREHAVLDGQRGILVTRHAPGSFTVALSDDVPFGLTRERDIMN
jgi:hypothetical protein